MMIILMLGMINLMGEDDGSWLMAKGSRPDPGAQGGGGAGPDRAAPLGSGAGPAPLGHEP